MAKPEFSTSETLAFLLILFSPHAPSYHLPTYETTDTKPLVLFPLVKLLIHVLFLDLVHQIKRIKAKYKVLTPLYSVEDSVIKFY